MVRRKPLEGKAAAKLRSIISSLDANNLAAAAQTARRLMSMVRDEETIFDLLPGPKYRSKLRRALNAAASSDVTSLAK